MTKQISIPEANSLKHSLIRLVVFVAVCVACLFFTLSVLVKDGRLIYSEGFPFVIGFGVLFGLAAVAEIGSLLLRLKKFLLG